MEKRLRVTTLALLVGGLVLESSTMAGSAEEPALRPGVRELAFPAPPTQGAPPRSLKGGTVTTNVPDDFYYYRGEPVRLGRSLTELVVRFRPGPAAARQQVVESVSPSASVGPEVQVEGRSFYVVTIPLSETGVSELAQSAERLRAEDSVEFVAPVLFYPATAKRLLPTDEVVVKLKAGGTRQELADLAAALGLTILKPMWGTQDEYVLRLDQPKAADPLDRARLLYETGRFEWAEPNFIQEFEKSAAPSDPRFGQQWHLSNTGQSGGTVGADVKAPAAWDLQTGSSSITIAVIDSGVEMTHEDLAANVFTNPGEIPGNGIDDDANGYVDDVSGWDFSSNDNDASPFATDDNHGTSVAGVAAGRGNNALGISGACQSCRILPVKIFLSTTYAGDTVVANAIRYAASLADVLNNSWGGGAPSSALQSAIQWAVTNGRGAKGSPVLFASGNSSSGYGWYSLTGVPAGTYRFRWEYTKDGSMSSGDDTAWLAWVLFPGNALETFETGSLPAGWTTGGNAAWSVVADGRHADEGVCFVHAAKAGTITDSQTTYVDAVKTVPAGTLVFGLWASSEASYDWVWLRVDANADGTFENNFQLASGVPAVVSGVSYPAAHPESIAVGASSNFDCRSHYSQFGPELEFVAPSSAGVFNLRIETTDRTGAAGYDAGDYTLATGSSGFGGTSSATPLAAGIAGLLLSRNPSLSVAQVKQALQDTAEKIGPEPYVSGRNDRYGSGRLDAYQALLAVSECATIAVSPPTLPVGAAGAPYSQSISASGGTPAYGFAVTVGSLPPGLTLSAGGLVSGTPTTPGSYGFSVRATDANGCSGYRAYTLVVADSGLPSLSITDVAIAEGNAGTSTATFTVSLQVASAQTVTVDYATADGSATAGSDYVAASGTLTFPPSSTSQTIPITVNGDTAVEPNETFFVNLSNPTNATIGDGQGRGTINDDDAPTCSVVAPGVLDGTFEAGSPWPDWTIQESTNFATPLCNTAGCGTGGGTAPPYAGDNWAWFGGAIAPETGVLGQSLALPTSTDLRLRFQMRIGAVNAPAADTLVVAVDGTPLQTFTEPAVAEPAYSLREISLTPYANGAVHALRFTYTGPDADNSNITVDNVEIVNCQGGGTPPSLSIGDASVTEGNAGTTTATFTVSLSAASGNTVTVSYSTADGTATAGSDYVAASGTVTFPPSSTTQSLSVTVNGDAVIEANETFFVNLSGATNATIADAQGVGTILNDDWPAVSINDVAVTEGNSGTTSATFTVSLSAASGQTVTVSYATANGTATAGSDYVAASGTVTFPPGSTTQSLPVNVNGDAAVEANETFFVNLSGATNATIADAQGVGTILNDDSVIPGGTDFYTLTPCRLVDTREADGPLGGPALQPGAQRTFALAGPKCAIPPTATAVSINVTVTEPTAQGNLRLFPTGVAVPLVSTINFVAGLNRANNAIVQLGGGATGSIDVLNSAAPTVHFVLDVNGYFQ